MRKHRTALTALAAATLLAACTAAADVDEAPDQAPTSQEQAEAPTTEPTPTPEPVSEPKPKPTPEPEPEPELGTRDNPGDPVDGVITFYDNTGDIWNVSVGYADFDAWDTVAAENPFNEPPAEGNTYVMVPLTVTYIAEEGSGTPWLDLDVSFVAADGRSFETAYQVIPESFNDIADLYTGGTGTGNLLFEVPADATEGGTWAVSYNWSEPMFVAALPE